jgi:hypothetical protein
MKAAQQQLSSLSQISKGEDWGIRLMKYAQERPELPDGQTRPIVKAVKIAVRSLYASHHETRVHYKVDPKSGLAIRRRQA